MSGQFQGLATVQANLAKAIKQIEGRTAGGVRKAALLIGREAKIKTPVDTGDLRNSQVISSDKINGEPISAIAYTQSYAPFVHENLEAHHPVGEAKFLERAVQENETRVVDIIQQEARI
jgi:hypothetical protein